MSVGRNNPAEGSKLFFRSTDSGSRTFNCRKPRAWVLGRPLGKDRGPAGVEPPPDSPRGARFCSAHRVSADRTNSTEGSDLLRALRPNGRTNKAWDNAPRRSPHTIMSPSGRPWNGDGRVWTLPRVPRELAMQSTQRTHASPRSRAYRSTQRSHSVHAPFP